jgi:hypothetical protein
MTFVPINGQDIQFFRFCVSRIAINSSKQVSYYFNKGQICKSICPYAWQMIQELSIADDACREFVKTWDVC